VTASVLPPKSFASKITLENRKAIQCGYF